MLTAFPNSVWISTSAEVRRGNEAAEEPGSGLEYVELLKHAGAGVDLLQRARTARSNSSFIPVINSISRDRQFLSAFFVDEGLS